MRATTGNMTGIILRDGMHSRCDNHLSRHARYRSSRYLLRGREVGNPVGLIIPRSKVRAFPSQSISRPGRVAGLSSRSSPVMASKAGTTAIFNRTTTGTSVRIRTRAPHMSRWLLQQSDILTSSPIFDLIADSPLLISNPRRK